MKRSQGLFIQQWRRTGKLNAHIEEAFTGHALVKVFGRQARGRAGLRRAERRAVQGVVRRAVRERPDHAGDDVHREPPVRRDRGRRRPARRERLDVARRRAGLHPVLPPVHPAADPGRLDGQPAAVRCRLGRAGLRAARRRGGGGRAGGRPADGDPGAAGRVRPRVLPVRRRPAADRGPVPRRPPRARPSRSSARPAPARRRWSTS